MEQKQRIDFKERMILFLAMNSSSHQLISLLLIISLLFNSSLSIEFVFNGFNSSDVILLGNATIESRTLTLTNNSQFSIGRALYKSKIPAKSSSSNISSYVYPFSTSFIFAMERYRDVLPGHGFVFLFAPTASAFHVDISTMAQNLGFINRTLMGKSTNRIFGVEFDVFKNEEFNDIDANHVGIDVNSLTSISSHTAGYWPEDGKSFEELELNSGRNYQVWIDYADSILTVTMVVAGTTRPKKPLLNVTVDLGDVFEEEMYVGFTAATGQLVQGHKILGWSFSNNEDLSVRLITTGLPSFVLPPDDSIVKSKGFIIGISIGFFFVLGILLYLFMIMKKKRKEGVQEVEEWESEYWPHKIVYRDIEAATDGFSDENVIGVGGNGKVYKGVLPGGINIAVKRISHDNNEGLRAFLSEIACLGRLKHRNLVGLRGWCKGEKGVLMLVYDYMENGSLEKRVFQCDENMTMLGCGERIRVLKDVACGVLYLHEGWEARVLHRDIKASNVLLDSEMNGRLGDFGLARMHEHGTVAGTTRVVGTVGYLAPEVIKTGRASAPTDVFGFGVLVLEVMCGRRPIEEGKPSLIGWVSELAGRGELMSALDRRIGDEGLGFEVLRVLQLGLLCAHPDEKLRPTMRQVVKVLEFKNCETENEKMDANLLQFRETGAFWSTGQNNFGNAASSHPTFEDLMSSSSTSLSWSSSVVEGR